MFCLFFAFKYELPSQCGYCIVTTLVSTLNLRGIEGPVGTDGGNDGSVSTVARPIGGATELADRAAVCEGCGTVVAVDDNFVES